MKTCNAHEVDQVALTSRLSYTFSKPSESNPGLQKRKYSFVQPIQTSKMEEIDINFILFLKPKVHTTYPNSPNEKKLSRSF
jgi:hypothetical protein